MSCTPEMESNPLTDPKDAKDNASHTFLCSLTHNNNHQSQVLLNKPLRWYSSRKHGIGAKASMLRAATYWSLARNRMLRQLPQMLRWGA